jgi:hypothetical protein
MSAFEASAETSRSTGHGSLIGLGELKFDVADEALPFPWP